MKFGVPWSVKGIRPEARETAREAARRSGMSLGDWLNSVIIQQAEQEGIVAEPGDDDETGDGDMAAVNERLDTLTQRIEQLSRTGPAAYAPKRIRDEPDQLADLINRLDRRLELFANMPRLAPMAAPAMPAAMPQPMMRQPVMSQPIPAVHLPPSLDRAVAEIAARKQALGGHAAPPRQQPRMTAPGPAAAAAAPTPMAAPVAALSAMPAAMPSVVSAPAPVVLPAQDLSGLEDQLRNITDQIETLRKPGVEEAINALREELGEIGRALNEAMPRRAIDAIDKQIKGLTQRIAEGRQAGVDAGALSGVEHGLAEVRDALRGLTPAENLIGFNDAVAGLAQKIDMIVAQKDPATLQQLEGAITTLRDMAAHVASDEAVHGLAAQVHALGEKIEYIAATGTGGDALNHLDQRISALADALAERAQNGATVPPRLEALVESLGDKIEQIQSTRGGGGDAFGHLEDRIVKLVEKLDASDSRISHLESIERGLADFLVQMEQMRANSAGGGLRANAGPGVDDLKHDIARTQDALEAVHGTLGHVVDRLAIIEKDIRSDGRARPAPAGDAPLTQAPGKVAVRFVEDAPPAAPAMPSGPAMAQPMPQPAAEAAPAAQPRRLPPAAQLPIDPDLPADQPLEPGSGPPPLRANPAARIAASEAALGGTRPAAPSAGKSSFIAAARRAAQAAVQEPAAPPRADIVEDFEPEAPSLRSKLTRRVKSLFIASCIIAVVIGSIQIAATMFDFGKPTTRTAQAPAIVTEQTAAAKPDTMTPAPRIASNPPVQPGLPGITAPGQSAGAAATANALPLGMSPPGLPSLFAPPMLGSNSDVTGSIPHPAASSRGPRNPAQPPQSGPQAADRLPAAIGGTHLRSAAVAGDPAAAFEIAARFAEGRGVPVNLEEAARWYERAANKGVAPAEFRYASMLEKGQGVKKDLTAARKYYLAAAAKGNGKAMHNVAVLYAEGIDGRPDYSTAVQWFRKAAQRGIADSEYNLGVLCARGLGTAKSYAEAYKWFALAAAQGDQESGKKRDEIAPHMDAADLASARAAVKSFVAEPQPREAVMVPEPSGGWDAAGAPAHGKPAPGAPLSLGSFKVGKR